jgi:hypothetical protein
MRRHIAVSATVAFLLWGAATSAQQAPNPAPTPAQSNDWSVENVVVSSRSSGPPIWHATKGTADVAILAVIEPLPEDYVWNSKELASVMDHAQRVVLQPRAETNIFQGVWFLLTNRELLSPPDGKTVWDYLDPALTSRFATARDMLKEDKDRYNDNVPAIAALRLENDFRRVNRMTIDEPEDTIRHLARARGLKVDHIATYDAMPSVKQVLGQPPGAAAKCVDAAVSDVNIAREHAAAAADAWAIGDVAGIKANWSQPKLYDCLLELSPLVTALDARATADTVKIIKDSLEAGGNTVVVVNIGLLLRTNGVLDRLTASGVALKQP